MGSNHAARLTRILRALTNQHLHFSLCNDLIDRQTTVYVTTHEGDVTITVRSPSLMRSAFHVEYGEDSNRFDTTQKDLIEMIGALYPPHNLVPIR